jgi:O-antigen/teichoic acid export membrane protein
LVFRFGSLAGPAGSLRRQLVQGAGIGVLLQSLNLLLGFGSGVLAARLLGPEGLGQYAYALAIAGVASIPVGLGLPTALVRFLVVYRQSGEWGLARGLLRRSNLLVGALGGGLAFLVLLVAAIVSGGSRALVFLLVAPLIPLLVWTRLRQAALQALHHPIAAQLPEQLIKPTAFLVLAGLLWMTNTDLGRQPQGLMAAWLLASVMAFLVGVGLLRRLSPNTLRDAAPRYDTRRWLSTALPLLATDGVGIWLSMTDIILLGIFRPATEVGLYHVAVRTAGLIVVFLTASNWVLAPWYARLHAAAEKERLQRIITHTIRGVFLLSFCVFAVFAIWGHALLEAFFGQSYAAAYGILVILAAARVANVAAGPVVNLMAMTGGQKALAWVMTVAAAANIIGCWLLIPRFGMYGAAITTAAATVGMNYGLVVIAWRRMGIRTTIFG